MDAVIRFVPVCWEPRSPRRRTARLGRVTDRTTPGHVNMRGFGAGVLFSGNHGEIAKAPGQAIWTAAKAARSAGGGA